MKTFFERVMTRSDVDKRIADKKYKEQQTLFKLLSMYDMDELEFLLNEVWHFNRRYDIAEIHCGRNPMGMLEFHPRETLTVIKEYKKEIDDKKYTRKLEEVMKKLDGIL